MLGSLFIAPLVEAVSAVLAANRNDGLIAVSGLPRLGRALAGRGHRVVVLSAKPRSLRRVAGDRVYARPDALPLADRAVAALVACSELGADPARVAEWSRAVCAGGLVILVDRAAAVESSRLALCGGLAEVQQREAGRTVVTSGVVVDL